MLFIIKQLTNKKGFREFRLNWREMSGRQLATFWGFPFFSPRGSHGTFNIKRTTTVRSSSDPTASTHSPSRRWYGPFSLQEKETILFPIFSFLPFFYNCIIFYISFKLCKYKYNYKLYPFPYCFPYYFNPFIETEFSVSSFPSQSRLCYCELNLKPTRW